MQLLKDLQYNKRKLVDNTFFYNDFRQQIYLEKSHNKSNEKDQYFLKLYYIKENCGLECQGYIYFYLDLLEKNSQFIGIYIKPEYRNRGFASLLLSNWIKFCLDNGIYNLETSKKQSKPFLLYLLKQYKFELADVKMYDWCNYTISICRNPNDLSKYLYFQNENQKKDFLKSAIMKEDNYLIVDELTENIHVLDRVICSTPYFIQDNESSYKKALINTSIKQR